MFEIDDWVVITNNPLNPEATPVWDKELMDEFLGAKAQIIDIVTPGVYRLEIKGSRLSWHWAERWLEKPIFMDWRTEAEDIERLKQKQDQLFLEKFF